MSAERITICAEFTARDGSADEVEALIREYARAVRAEPGNLVFDVYRRAEVPDRFLVFEEYADRDAFDGHLAAESGRAFNAALEPRIVEPTSVLSHLTRVAGA
ncbi:putative quinol monooxygenase [Microbacterium suwonense]|uniref:ABM domain-containing protein n=1 Tax=Microbacterium suwonense TaxID=683047 RepID=A0ABM8FQ50_9MICO|nr:putative quinol monooxygenase [Microbacterium suwonense]BDZ37532.1 hypothetical protein GCM10025863_01460 [Microbacterium suwonense]